jgi:hypothetical protein
MAKSLPPLHDIAAMSGINLPSYLGNLQKDEAGEAADNKQAKSNK